MRVCNRIEGQTTLNCCTRRMNAPPTDTRRSRKVVFPPMIPVSLMRIYTSLRESRAPLSRHEAKRARTANPGGLSVFGMSSCICFMDLPIARRSPRKRIKPPCSAGAPLRNPRCARASRGSWGGQRTCRRTGGFPRGWPHRTSAACRPVSTGARRTRPPAT